MAITHWLDSLLRFLLVYFDALESHQTPESSACLFDLRCFDSSEMSLLVLLLLALALLLLVLLALALLVLLLFVLLVLLITTCDMVV
jgi:hypothetical protein